MNKNLNIIAKELFGKIRTQFPNVKLGDEDSKVTSKPEEARFFDFDYTNDGDVLGRISISLSIEDGLVVIYSADIVSDVGGYAKKRFFNFLKEIREFAKQHLLNFDTRDIAKSNLEKRDYETLSQNNGETKMSESKLFGTSKTSYQNLGDAKIIVKHTAPVNFENPAGRTQRIESIYIENAQGERFKYPYKHLNGARALAQHVAHGGNPYDSIGGHVIGLSEELSKLRMFKHYVERNDTISEAMGSINSKVMERIDQVKKEIHSLQVSRNYEQFAESFTESEKREIPEEILNDWIDRLTVRTFNEELKNVFPYIFKLVDESEIPIKEISAEDLLDQVIENSDTFAKETVVPELTEYEQFLNQIVGEGTDIFSDDSQAAIEQLNQLIAEPFPVGVDGTNAIEALSDIIKDDELMDIFKELADVSPEADVRDILQDYITMKDQENGTDIANQLTFGSEQPAPVEEPAPAEPAAAPPVDPAAAPPVDPAAAPAAAPAPVMADIWGESKEDPPFDPDEKPSKDVTPGKSGQGHSKAKHLAKKGMQDAIKKAKKAGATAETIIRIAGKEMTLGEAVAKAGMTVEDVFGNKSEELVEFIKSMYNSEEGNFPKGETGVLIACEKKFGENVVPMAQKVVEKLTNLGETSRMKKLAGMR
jgi:DNA-binding transcriptional regulator YhcF (GntR family)